MIQDKPKFSRIQAAKTMKKIKALEEAQEYPSAVAAFGSMLEAFSPKQGAKKEGGGS